MPSTSPDSRSTQPPTPSQPEILMQMISGYWVSQSIYVAAKLDLADRCSDDRPTAYTELASATQTDAASIYRLMRGLASVGIFAETTPGEFVLTPLAKYLRSDAPGSLQGAAIMMGDAEHYQSWGHLLHSVQTGQSAFEHCHGMNVFEYYDRHPIPAATFDRAMTSFSSLEIQGTIAAYDFSEFHSLVDVAGGSGHLLAAIMQQQAHLKGILFDLPHVVERAKSQPIDSTLSDRWQFVSGSFFETLPAGADAYLLKHIVHDWDDERSIAILRQCRSAMASNPNSRVLVIETVIPPGNEPFIGKLLDLNMLVMCPGGRERTEAEYRALFEAAGLTLTRIVPTASSVSLVEGVC